jgi:SAM-dependent methyltransferase
MTHQITDAVKQKYAAVAASGLSNTHVGVQAVAEAFGYSAEELASIPAEANMGLSCGNPTATARLRPGEVVVDLGSGGGLDVFLAAQKVGPTGKAIGIDMTPEMIQRARDNAQRQGLANVEFHLATIDKLPLSESSVDCIISNCVINLAEDKSAVFREMHRVLKPGGRVAISDIALKQPLPPEIGNDLLAYVGCIAGAISIADYTRGFQEAGFTAVQIIDTNKDLNAYSKIEGQSGCCSPPFQGGAGGITSPSPLAGEGRGGGSPLDQLHAPTCCSPSTDIHSTLADLLRKYNINDYAASVQVYAVKSKPI